MTDHDVELDPRIFAGTPPTLWPRPNWLRERQEAKALELAEAERQRQLASPEVSAVADIDDD